MGPDEGRAEDDPRRLAAHGTAASAFDPWVVGASRRCAAALEPRYKARVYRPQGWITPVVLVNGRMVGVWRHQRKGRRLLVEIDPFGRLPAWARAEVEAEAERLAEFLEGELDSAKPQARKALTKQGSPRLERVLVVVVSPTALALLHLDQRPHPGMDAAHEAVGRHRQPGELDRVARSEIDDVGHAAPSSTPR